MRSVISTGFSEAESARFHNLLKLAADSSYEGERENAMAAAQRLAERCGMTMDEAARSAHGPFQKPSQPEANPETPEEAFDRRRAEAFARAFHLSEAHVAADKKRRAEALRRARERGLEEEADTKKASAARARKVNVPNGGSSNRGRRMKRHDFARRLLRETRLPAEEIASITELDVYEVYALKLKMRNAA